MTGYESTTPNTKGSPIGVGGWLAFLIAGLTVLGPAIGAAELFIGFRRAELINPSLSGLETWHSYKQISWYLFLAVAVVSIGLGLWLACSDRRIAVTSTLVGIWLIGPLTTLLEAMVIAPTVLQFVATPEYLGESLGKSLGSVLICAAWTLYLARSKRVKNTYR